MSAQPAGRSARVGVREELDEACRSASRTAIAIPSFRNEPEALGVVEVPAELRRSVEPGGMGMPELGHVDREGIGRGPPGGTANGPEASILA